MVISREKGWEKRVHGGRTTTSTEKEGIITVTSEQKLKTYDLKTERSDKIGVGFCSIYTSEDSCVCTSLLKCISVNFMCSMPALLSYRRQP